MSEKPKVLIVAHGEVAREGLLTVGRKDTAWDLSYGSLTQPPEPEGYGLVVAALHSEPVGTWAEVRRLLALCNGVPLVLWGPPPEPEPVVELLAQGLRGYLYDDASGRVIRSGIAMALEGGLALDPRLTEAFLRALAVASGAAGDRRPVALTPRQREVAQAVAEGRGYEYASQVLGIDADSVRRDWHRIRQAISAATGEDPRQYVLHHVVGLRPPQPMPIDKRVASQRRPESL